MKTIQLKNKTDLKISDYIYYKKLCFVSENNLNYIIPNEVEKIILNIDPILELITN